MKFDKKMLSHTLSCLLIGTLLLSAAGCKGQQKNVRDITAKVSESSVSVSDRSAESVIQSSVWTPSTDHSSAQESKPSESPSSQDFEVTSAESQTGESSSAASQESQVSESSLFSLPDEYRDNGIFSDYYEEAYRYMSQMTLEEKIGQMIVAAKPAEDEIDLAREYHLGGYVLFGSDFVGKSKEQVQAMTSSLAASQKIPLAFGVDEEGGTVTRISAKPQLSSHEFQSPRELYKNGGMAYIQSDADEKATLLKELGLDINFAPVCDLSDNKNDFIYERSLGQDPETTGEFVRIVTEISQSKGVSATLKHFPGYGGNADTHIGLSVDHRTLEELRTKDFVPFRAGIQAGAHCIMVSHNIVNSIEKDVPCSLSPAAHKIIREELGFTGLILTDDLSMGAVAKYSGSRSPAVAAVLAGNDVLLMSSGMVTDAVESVKASVADKTIDEKIIDRAVLRILSWKYAKGMM